MTRELFDSFLDVMRKQADLIDFENVDAEYSNELEKDIRRLGLKLSEIYGVQEMKKLIKDWANNGSFFLNVKFTLPIIEKEVLIW